MLILSAALLLTGGLSLKSIRNLQGNARVINYTGIIRGATQKLVKKELNQIPDSELMEQLDKILLGLSEGSREFNLIKLKSPQFQELISQMKRQWTEMKAEISRYREDGKGDALFELSEDYFKLADQAVQAAEQYTEDYVKKEEKVLFFMNLFFVLLAVLNVMAVFCYEKRQKRLEEAEKENWRKSRDLSKRIEEMLVPINEIPELMYISDIETHNLLFVNDAAKELFHMDEKEGMKCYRLLQGLDEPCPFCTTPLIKKDKNYTWEYTNPLTSRHYLLKDRLIEWEGHPARMEIAFDITENAIEREELKERLEGDNILLECIRELYCNHDMSKAIMCVLEQVGKQFLAERAYVFSNHGEYISNTAEWCKEGIEPQRDKLQNIHKNEFSTWLNMFQNRKSLVIEDVETLKKTMDMEYEFLTAQGIKSVVMVPLDQDGKLNGLIGLDNPSSKKLKYAVSFFETLRYFLMLSIRRNKDEEMLSKLSYHDMLTSFYNRNRYIKDIGSLDGENYSLGVVYLDVNGLKEINDTLGHDAGDMALKECANTIQDVFKTGSFYRVGGDEFVIICTQIQEVEFQKFVVDLKDSFQNKNCKVAIGAKWTTKCDNIQSVIASADKAMYDDKEKFYQKYHPAGRPPHTTSI